VVNTAEKNALHANRQNQFLFICKGDGVAFRLVLECLRNDLGEADLGHLLVFKPSVGCLGSEDFICHEVRNRVETSRVISEVRKRLIDKVNHGLKLLVLKDETLLFVDDEHAHGQVLKDLRGLLLLHLLFLFLHEQLDLLAVYVVADGFNDESSNEEVEQNGLKLSEIVDIETKANVE
jgi:hypothetical protein